MSDKPSPYSYRVKSIKKIIDGDTFDCIMDLGFDVLLEARVRMMGIDTPESRTRDLEEKKYGKMASNFLSDAIKDAEVVALRTHKDSKGKYGRILGEIICDGVNINQVMVETHLAVAYFGQSKEDIAEQHLQNRELIDHQTLFGHNE